MEYMKIFKIKTILFLFAYMRTVCNGQDQYFDWTIAVQNLFSLPQRPIFDLLKQTMSPNYSPNNPTDMFDVLRDRYDLPRGLKSPYMEYDYVIVGAGSAGCVLAARLTEDPNVTVLLLEAGKPEMFITDVPSIAPYFQRTDYAWQYYMEPQPNVCLGMENKRCFWPRGKAVGGTSVINYMIYTRGRPAEWNQIAAAGNKGWSYNDVLFYYKKSERANLNGLEKSPYRSTTGDMNVEFVKFRYVVQPWEGLRLEKNGNGCRRTPLVDAFLEAGRILGHPTVDYNSPDELGFGYVQTHTRNGRRLSAAKAFLYPNRHRPNLHILPMTTATKVLINEDTKSAYGIQYVRNRLKQKVKVRREVILSAGPIASPQLLMLSGIGPKEHLGRHSIPVLQDLPVGRTLYDHITFPGIIFTLSAQNVSMNENRDGNIPNFLKWLRRGDTVVASPGGVEGIGYIQTPLFKNNQQIPDIELINVGGTLLSDGGPYGSKAIRRGMRIIDEVFDSAFGSVDNTDAWCAFPMLLHPKSVGYIELKDNNPFSHPRMYGNYLTDPLDVATFVAAIKHVQALAATEPFQRFGAKIHKAEYPACKNLQFDSDAYWECAVRTLTATLHHQIATCRMGPKGDPLAVVDPELRVHGIRHLRVVDSSILPQTISAHTHAPAVMIGEKAADMIKATWR